MSILYSSIGGICCRAPDSGATCALPNGSRTGAELGYTNEGQQGGWQNTLAGTPTTTAQYAYDGEGHRVASNVQSNGVTTSTTDYLAGGLEEVTTAGSTTTLTKYEAVPGVCNVVIVGSGPSETVSYVTTDGLGSVSEALDSSGNVTAQQLFGPYGTGRFALGTMPTSKGFTGQYGDATTGLDYYGARYYDPLVGQFTQADTAGDGLNRYAYVHDDPETATDPTGNRCVADGGVCPGAGGGGGSGGCGQCGKSPCAPNCSTPKQPPTPTSPSGGKGSGGCQSENCGGTVTTYDCTNLAVAEAISACNAYTSAKSNDDQAREDALADEKQHAALLIFLGTILGAIVDLTELAIGGTGVVEKIKALVDLALTVAGGFYWLSVYQGSKAGSPLVSTVLRVLNGIATVGNSVIAMIRELGAAAQWAIDNGWTVIQTLAESVPGLLTTIAVNLAGNTVLDLLSGGFHAMLSQGNQLYADYQRQENMDIGAWCAAHPSAECEPIPSSTVSV